MQQDPELAPQLSLRQKVCPKFVQDPTVCRIVVHHRQHRQSLPKLLRQWEVLGRLVLKLSHFHITADDYQLLGLRGIEETGRAQGRGTGKDREEREYRRGKGGQGEREEREDKEGQGTQKDREEREHRGRGW